MECLKVTPATNSKSLFVALRRPRVKKQSYNICRDPFLAFARNASARLPREKLVCERRKRSLLHPRCEAHEFVRRCKPARAARSFEGFLAPRAALQAFDLHRPHIAFSDRRLTLGVVSDFSCISCDETATSGSPAAFEELAPAHLHRTTERGPANGKQLEKLYNGICDTSGPKVAALDLHVVVDSARTKMLQHALRSRVGGRRAFVVDC